MKKVLKDNKAITLIALVITIVVLIILAAVAINLSLGNNGIFNRAKTAKEQYSNAQEYEQATVADSSDTIDSHVGGNRENNNKNYSTSEHVVGTWIDGSQVWSVTIAAKIPTKHGGTIADVSEYNIKQAISVTGIMDRNDGIHTAIAWSANSGDMASVYFDSGYTKLLFYGNHGSFFSQNVWITIEYIKK